MAIGHYGRNIMTTKPIQISQTTTDKNGNTNLHPHADAVCRHRDGRWQLVSIDTWARDIRYGSTWQ